MEDGTDNLFSIPAPALRQSVCQPRSLLSFMRYIIISLCRALLISCAISEICEITFLCSWYFKSLQGRFVALYNSFFLSLAEVFQKPRCSHKMFLLLGDCTRSLDFYLSEDKWITTFSWKLAVKYPNLSVHVMKAVITCIRLTQSYVLTTKRNTTFLMLSQIY